MSSCWTEDASILGAKTNGLKQNENIFLSPQCVIATQVKTRIQVLLVLVLETDAARLHDSRDQKLPTYFHDGY